MYFSNTLNKKIEIKFKLNLMSLNKFNYFKKKINYIDLLV